MMKSRDDCLKNKLVLQLEAGRFRLERKKKRDLKCREGGVLRVETKDMQNGESLSREGLGPPAGWAKAASCPWP